jgi:hypothetical protein
MAHLSPQQLALAPDLVFMVPVSSCQLAVVLDLVIIVRLSPGSWLWFWI